MLKCKGKTIETSVHSLQGNFKYSDNSPIFPSWNAINRALNLCQFVYFEFLFAPKVQCRVFPRYHRSWDRSLLMSRGLCDLVWPGMQHRCTKRINPLVSGDGISRYKTWSLERLLPDNTKSLLEPMLIHHHWDYMHVSQESNTHELILSMGDDEAETALEPPSDLSTKE